MPNDAQMPELLPCPFCGGEAKVYGPVGWYRQYGISHSCRVFYGGSGDFTLGASSEDEAVAQWNRRADLCASGQQVRALVWEQVDPTAVLGRGIEPCQYYIRYEVGSWWMPGDAEVEDAQEFDDLEAAKAAAQADYERRILSALTPARQSEGQVQPDAQLNRTFRARSMSELKQMIYDAHGWKRKAGESQSGRIKPLYDFRVDHQSNMIVATPRAPAPSAATPTAQEAAPVVSPEALIDLIGEFGREVYYLLDDCETSGPVGKEIHTITDESLTKVSAILDRIDALPFEEPGVILGTGAMLQAAIKQTFQTHPPQPSETVAEALRDLLHAVCGETGFAACVRHDSGLAYPWPALDEAEKNARAALRALKGEGQ